VGNIPRDTPPGYDAPGAPQPRGAERERPLKFGTLQVFPRSGLLQEHGLELPSAVVGRGEGSSIVIEDFSVARRHARLTVDSGRLLVEDLGSASGTFVNGERLEPGVRHLVEPDATLRFGEIEARYLAPAATELPSGPALVEEGTTVVSAGGLSIALVSPAVPIDPGKQAAATLVVTNRGRLVDQVTVEITDLPEEWYTIESPARPILPGGRADVNVILHPPRRHDSLAGEYTFTVRVRSREYDEHPETAGSFTLLPFESASFNLAAVRSSKNFRLIAENHGNDVASYTLQGRDEEQAFKYWFETPVVELQPGEKRTIRFTVRRPRQLFGPPKQPPFEIIGASAASGAEITARGQLAIRPPLERFKMPAVFALAAVVLAATALAVLVIADNGGNTATAQDPYAGVHLCEDDDAREEQAKRNAESANKGPVGAQIVGPYDGGSPITFGQVDNNGAPFFAQSDPRWGGDEYARSTELPNGKDWCGTTIEQCGCAMTSVSVMLAMYGLLNMPDGLALTPQSLNDWFNGAARKTDRGWVSRGYIYGDVIWAAANELSAEIAKVRPGAPTVRFARTGSGDEAEIRADLEAGRPVILEVPGHWIAAVGLDGDDILINDPFYRDRKTLDVYAGKVRSSVHYEPSQDLSSVVITAPADVRFKITDKQGRVVNTGEGTIQQPGDVINQIPGASVSQKAAWRDPTCIESAPPPDAGTNQVVLPGSRDDYTIEIVGTGTEPASIAVHTYGRDGSSSIATIEGQEGTKAELEYDPNADKPVIHITNNGTPVATATPPQGDGAGGGDDDETPSPSATPPPPPTATATPFVEQRTAMTLPAEPGQTRVEVATNSGFELGDPIRFAPGLPNEEDNIIVGFGSFVLATPLKFAHSPGEPILRLQRPPGQGPGLPPGITPPPDAGPIEPPDSVVIQCSTIYQPSPKLATLICDLTIDGDYTTTRWTLNGKIVTEFSGSTNMVLSFQDNVPANISATVCNQTLCRSTSRLDNVEFPPGISGPTLSGGGTSGSGGAGAAPTPTGSQVTITCGTEFDQTQNPAVANITCQANFSGAFTSVSWSAPGGKPASASGPSKEFKTQLVNNLGAPTTLKITATVCNFGNCRTSSPQTVGIGQTRIIVDAEPKNPVTLEREVHQRHTVTLFAAVVGLNGIVPQGGNVQFYADNNEIQPSAPLFTVGSTSVAQISVETGSRLGLTTIGTHQIFAVYSGGINAFGSTSDVTDLEVLPPLPDQCDSVDEDTNNVIDDFTTSAGDASCDISLPRNLGGGTVLQSLALSTGNAAHQDGAPNAVVVPPGQPVTITGTVGRTEYCPGCIRQVYIGIAGYDTQPSPTFIGPSCVYSGGTPLVPTAFGTAPVVFNAPTTPGVYYVRATTTLDYFCVGPPVGPPDRSVGRIIVRGPVVSQLEIYPASSPTDINPWDEVLSTQVSSVDDGQKLVILAKVPPGATGRVDIQGVGGAALSAPVCPPSGQVLIPSIQATPIACTPGEARVMTPVITDAAATLLIRGRYENSSPAQLTSPQTGDPTAYPFYESPDQTNPGCTPASPTCPYPPGPANPNGWAGSNVVQVKVRVTPSVTLVATPNPVEFGQQFTLTATVVSANSALGLFGTGGIVKFMNGTEQIGTDQTIVNADGTVSINWTPKNCNGPVNCGAANMGFPFNAQDETGATNLYTNVHAKFEPGTSELKAGQSAAIDVDVDRAGSTTSLALSTSSVQVGGTLNLTATVTPSWGLSPSGGQVQFKYRTSTQGIGSASNLGNAVSLTETSPGVWQAIVNNLSVGNDNDAIGDSGNYLITAHFLGLTEIDGSVSGDQPLAVTKVQPTLTLTLPAGNAVTVGDTSATDVRATITGSPSGRLDDSPARLKFFNGTTELDDDPVSNLGSGVLGNDMEVSTLNAGSYSISVQYTGNAFFDAATTPAQTLTVNKFTPSISVNTITAVTVGDSLSLSATLQCGSGACSGIRSHAGGSVSFYVGSVATGNLLGTDTDISAGGTASITVSTGDSQLLALANTAYSIIAVFNGDATNGNLDTATSSGQPVTLNIRSSTTTVQNITANLGDTVNLTATVSSGSANVSPDCSACVQFKYGASLGTATDIGTKQSVTNGTATLANVSTGASTPFSSNSAYTIWAVYDGKTNLVNGGNDSGTLTLATAVTVTVSAPATTEVGVQVQLQATVSPTSAPGTVQFKIDGTNFGSAQTLSGGSASINWTPSSTGARNITASYTSSSTNYLSDPDSNTAVVTVNPRTVTVTVSANSSVTLGSSITLTATLSPSAAPGTVRFFADGTEVSGVNGVAADTSDGTTTFSWTPASVGDGTASITATYTSSDANYASQGTSNSVNVTVNPASTSTTATAAQTGGAGSSITMTADITSGFGAQTDIDSGTVTFTITGGAGACTLPNGGVASVTNGVATLTGVSCPAGNNYNVRGSYSGGGNYAASADTSDFDLDVN